MADLKISELAALAGANLAAGDLLPVVDVSASETKRITVTDLVGNATTLIADATIPGAKILFGAGSIAGSAIATGGIGTTQLANDGVTADKLANESTVDLVTTLPGSGAFTGQLALDTDDLKVYCWDGSAWQSIKAAGSINTVSGSTAGTINIVVSQTGTDVTISATLDNTSAAAQFLAGPTANAGAVAYRTIAGGDLPVATTAAKGAVLVNGEGLRMDGDQLEVDNDVTASGAIYSVVQYSSKGLVTTGRAITSADLPAATSGAKGAVTPGTGLAVDGAGVLNHSNSAATGTFTKVTIDSQGHVTSGEAIAAGDLPNHSAALLTTGTLDAARVSSSSITGAKLANYAVSKFGETQPAADHIGQFFFNPLTRELYLWDGNVYQPVGISAGEIVLAGTYNANTNLLNSVTADGTAAGFVSGQALPAAAAVNSRYYVVVSTAGTGTSPAPAVGLEPPDLLLSNGSSYIKLDVSDTITAVVATNVGFTPYGNIAASNVQGAVQELDDEKLAKAGGTVTGQLLISPSGSLVFEGATDNDFETTLAVADPTADRTITLPNVTGTVVTTGDSGTVTSTMIADGTIVNADINASAAIAGTKISPDFGSQNITTTGRALTGTSTALANVYAIGTALTPAVQIESNTGNGAALSITRHTAAAANLLLQRGVTGTPVADTEALGQIGFNGFDGTSYYNAALIRGVVEGTPGAGSMPGRLSLQTTPTGSTTPVERLRLDAAGQVMAASLGTAALPVWSFTGDPNTGVYSPGADQLALTTGGTARVTVASTGRVTVANSAVGTVSALGNQSGTITLDLATANNYSMTLNANSTNTLANPTNQTAGQSGAIVITQDGTGSRTLAYGSNWKFPGGTAPTLTTAANAVDVIAYYVESASRITARLISDVK